MTMKKIRFNTAELACQVLMSEENIKNMVGICN